MEAHESGHKPRRIQVYCEAYVWIGAHMAACSPRSSVRDVVSVTVHPLLDGQSGPASAILLFAIFAANQQLPKVIRAPVGLRFRCTSAPALLLRVCIIRQLSHFK